MFKKFKYYMGLFLALLFLSAIIYLMGLFNWGSLPKDQTNPQLITEAITEAIIAHEEDPTAHLGPGESLEQHKSNEVIDHPASSILPDKFSQIQNLFYNTWESISDWFSYGTISNGFLALRLTQRGDFSGDRYLWCETIEFLTNQSDDSILDNIWQAEFRYYQNYHTADYSFGMNIGEAYTPMLITASFKIENGVLYSVFGNDEEFITVNLGALENSRRYSVRVETVAMTQTLNFYLDGVLVATYDLSEIPSFYMPMFGIYSKKVGGTLSSQSSYLQFRYLAIGNSTF